MCAHGRANRGDAYGMQNDMEMICNEAKNEMSRSMFPWARKPRKWHTECNEAKMICKMQNGLTPTWVSLNHTHIRGRRTKLKCLEMRAHGHANRGNGRKAWNGMEMICKHANEFPALTNDAKQSRKVGKWHQMHGMVPKCDIKHPKWPTAILNMRNWNMKWKSVARQPPK